MVLPIQLDKLLKVIPEVTCAPARHWCQANIRKAFFGKKRKIIRKENLTLEQNGEIGASPLDMLQIEQREPCVIAEENGIGRQLRQQLFPVKLCRIVSSLDSDVNVTSERLCLR